MKANCKFCGAEVSVPDYIGGEKISYSCGMCSRYCMKECEEVRRSIDVNWHTEPCISCEHNPYHIKHVWNGAKWVSRTQQN